MQNFVTMTGRFTADCEEMRTKKGTRYTLFRLAVPRDVNPNIRGQSVDFIPCQAWNKVLDVVLKYGKKGTIVTIQGRIQSNRDYGVEEPDLMVYVIVSKVYFLQYTISEIKRQKREKILKAEKDQMEYERQKRNPYDFENLDPFDEEEYPY